MGKSIALEVGKQKCSECDFIADGIYELGKHITEKHPMLFIWHASNFESNYKKITSGSELKKWKL